MIQRRNLIFNAGYLKQCLNDLRVKIYVLKYEKKAVFKSASKHKSAPLAGLFSQWE